MKRKNIPIILALISTIILLICALLMVLTQKEKEGLLEPTGLLMTSEGVLYVADAGNQAVLSSYENKITRVAGYTLLGVGEKAKGSYQDGEEKKALFNQPSALAHWLNGMVVSDTGNHRLRLIQDGKVKTLAGSGVQGCHNDFVNEATFYHPQDIAVGPDGNLYVADSGNGCIRKVTAQGMVETVVSGLNLPTGLCWSKAALYIADRGSHQILCWDGQEISVVAGQWNEAEEEQGAGFQDGLTGDARFRAPQGVLVVDDIIYVADTGNSAIRKIENGVVETIVAFNGTGSDLWPAQPKGMTAHGNTLYVADSFAGVVFTLDLG